MNSKVLIFFSFLSIALVNIRCDRIVEPITHGDYYITNNTTSMLIISAFFGSEELQMLANEIKPGEKTHIYTFTEGSGGHVMPSNAWDDFIIYSENISEENIVYSGINNSDWEFEGCSNDGHMIYNLVID